MHDFIQKFLLVDEEKFVSHSELTQRFLMIYIICFFVFCIFAIVILILQIFQQNQYSATSLVSAIIGFIPGAILIFLCSVI
jgi:cell division protein FtsI/penicillin-binding protein 2